MASAWDSTSSKGVGVPSAFSMTSQALSFRSPVRRVDGRRPEDSPEGELWGAAADSSADGVQPQQGQREGLRSEHGEGMRKPEPQPGQVGTARHGRAVAPQGDSEVPFPRAQRWWFL